MSDVMTDDAAANEVRRLGSRVATSAEVEKAKALLGPNAWLDANPNDLTAAGHVLRTAIVDGALTKAASQARIAIEAAKIAIMDAQDTMVTLRAPIEWIEPLNRAFLTLDEAWMAAVKEERGAPHE